MSYGIELKKDVKRFLSKHEDIAKVFYQKITFLALNPYENNLDIKPYK